MDEAGKAAIRAINPLSIEENKEYGGIVAKDLRTGKYFYTAPKSGDLDSVTQQDQGLAPFYAYVVADYHTHGAYTPGYESEKFSSDDKDANAKGAPPHFYPMGYGKIYGYLGTPSGTVMKYDPWNDQPQIIGEGEK
jgi:hypothetical protein